VDFEYGTPIGNGIYYHIGGFVRSGEGPRAAGYNASQGGQFRSKHYKGARIRLHSY
jgi:hypothetical protein